MGKDSESLLPLRELWWYTVEILRGTIAETLDLKAWVSKVSAAIVGAVGYFSPYLLCRLADMRGSHWWAASGIAVLVVCGAIRTGYKRERHLKAKLAVAVG